MTLSLSELLDGIPPRGRRTTLSATKRRDIDPPDLVALRNAKPLEQVAPVQQLRHQHHLLARLLAEGKSVTESAEITGYSVTYISRLKTQDRAFKELIKYYGEQVNEIFVNVHERLAGLGINTVEELQERLAEQPGSFTHRELMELAELCLDRSGHGPTSTNRSVVALLTGEDIARLKSEISSRSLGSVRMLPSGDLSADTASQLGSAESLSKAEADVTATPGPELSEKIWEAIEKEL
jgi:hypothetical protein